MDKNSRVLIYEQIVRLLDGHTDAVAIAKKIESGCYDAAKREVNEGRPSSKAFTYAYSAICYRVMHALSTSDSLCDGIRSGSIAPADLGIMKAEQLNPDANIDIRKAINERAESTVERRVCHAYTCPGCNKNNTDGGVSRQLRSADEGSTMIITCFDCGKSWRIG